MTTPLIPRKLIFGNPEKTNVQISPDGAYISYLAPVNGVLNAWVAPREKLSAARAVTMDTVRGVRVYGWIETSKHIFYIQDKGGDENWRLYVTDIVTGETRDMTPFEGVTVQSVVGTHKDPDHLVVTINKRDPQWHDVYRLDITTGELTLMYENNSFAGFDINDDLEIVLGTQMLTDGGIAVLKKMGDDWQPFLNIPQEDSLTTATAGIDRHSQNVYLTDSRGRNTSALYIANLATGEKKLIAEDPQADMTNLILHPTEKHIQAVSFTYDRKRWQFFDPAIENAFHYLRTVADGDVEINSTTRDQKYWIVVFVSDNYPTRYYLYNRDAQKATYLFSNRPELEKYELTKMYPALFKARDGLDLVGYYSLPVGSDSNGDGIPDQPLPMVLTPHGGPWGRDYWGFSPWAQWLTNRGYVVMTINFRSSTGFGKQFINAGDKQWGEAIVRDQEDAVRWAVQNRIANPAKVAIMGGSFGGYSTLAGLTMFPDLYACGVDLVGPSNLITLLETIPPYWKPMLELFTTRVGDPRTEEGRALLQKHSPLTYVDQIRRPLLIGQGANDPRVKQAESDQIVKAMQEKGIPVTYLLYPDEGHGFARPENNLSFYAVTEQFLSECLGGRAEPVGEDFEGSSVQVMAGTVEN